MSIKETLTAKYGGVPVWAWGAGGAVLAAGAVWWFRRGKAGASSAAQSLQDQYANAGLGGGAGSAGGQSDTPSQQPQYQYLFQPQQDAQQTNPDPVVSKQAVSTVAPARAASAQPSSVAQTAVSMGIPITQLLNPDTLLSSYNVQNAAPEPTAGYSPSALDYLSALPGGLDAAIRQVGGSTADSGQTYTQYNTLTGTGAYVPPAQRITGERYDAAGRVIE